MSVTELRRHLKILIVVRKELNVLLILRYIVHIDYNSVRGKIYKSLLLRIIIRIILV